MVFLIHKDLVSWRGQILHLGQRKRSNERGHPRGIDLVEQHHGSVGASMSSVLQAYGATARISRQHLVDEHALRSGSARHCTAHGAGARGSGTDRVRAEFSSSVRDLNCSARGTNRVDVLPRRGAECDPAAADPLLNPLSLVPPADPERP